MCNEEYEVRGKKFSNIARKKVNDDGMFTASSLHAVVCPFSLLTFFLLTSSVLYYTLRVQQNGQYLGATPNPDRPDRYILVFREAADALSYLDAHAPGFADRFAVETLNQAQVASLLDRWGFVGVGLVRDPRLPDVEFAARLG